MRRRRRKKKKKKKEEEEGEEEEEEELKAFAMIKKMNQFISTSPGSTSKTTYNN